MSKYYIYKMNILDNPLYFGSYIGQHKIGKKEPMKDGYKGSGSDWKKFILNNRIPVEKEILCFCESVEEANKMEDYYINQYKPTTYLWNKRKGGYNHNYDKKYTEEELREHNKAHCKKWYLENKERNLENGRRNRKLHKEQYAETKRAYEKKNKEHIAKIHAEYYEKNKERLNTLNKQRYYENREERIKKMRIYGKAYREANKEKIRIKGKKYNDSHKEEHKKYRSQLCYYEGKTMTLNALSLKFLKQGVENPTKKAKEYLILS